LLAGSAAAHLEEAVDYRVEIDFVLVRHFETSPAAKERAQSYVYADSKRVARLNSRRKGNRGASKYDALLEC
jgi:hypothetical protein